MSAARSSAAPVLRLVPAPRPLPQLPAITPVGALLERLAAAEDTSWDALCPTAADERGMQFAIDGGYVFENRAPSELVLTGRGRAYLLLPPAMRAKVRFPTYADPSCYACRGRGATDGYRHDGTACPCVASCGDCGEDFAWTHDDEHAPRYCPTCARLQAAGEKLEALLALTEAGVPNAAEVVTVCSPRELAFVRSADPRELAEAVRIVIGGAS